MAIKKKEFDIKKLMWIGGVATAILSLTGAVVASSKTITIYAELPKEVSEVKKEIDDVGEYIKEQRMANKLMQEMVEHKNKVLSPDGKMYFDEDDKKWKKVVRHE